MSSTITTIGLDADDTLWQNEHFYQATEARFAALLADYGTAEDIGSHLLAAERVNLKLYGFGIKGFTLSMVQTAIEMSGGQVPGNVIGEILAAGREMLVHPVETLPGVPETLKTLASDFRLVLITKGDLFDQERKLAESGLSEMFDGVEIVSDKSEATYRGVFTRHGEGPERAIMVGNSLKSDVLPAITAGAWGVYVPHEIAWAVEHEDEPVTSPRYRRLDALVQLPALIDEISRD